MEPVLRHGTDRTGRLARMLRFGGSGHREGPGDELGQLPAQPDRSELTCRCVVATSGAPMMVAQKARKMARLCACCCASAQHHDMRMPGRRAAPGRLGMDFVGTHARGMLNTGCWMAWATSSRPGDAQCCELSMPVRQPRRAVAPHDRRRSGGVPCRRHPATCSRIGFCRKIHGAISDGLDRRRDVDAADARSAGHTPSRRSRCCSGDRPFGAQARGPGNPAASGSKAARNSTAELKAGDRERAALTSSRTESRQAQSSRTNTVGWFTSSPRRPCRAPACSDRAPCCSKRCQVSRNPNARHWSGTRPRARCVFLHRSC